MELDYGKISLLIIPAIFLIILFIFWILTANHRKKEYGKHMWKLWGARTFYWEGAIYLSTGITILILFILKWLHLISF